MAMTLPHDYEDSRRRFLALGAAAGAAMLSFPAPQDRIGAPPLFTDTALLDAESADTLVVIASGTHGVEGYAGAACQFRFLQAYARDFAASGIAFLLVHAVNPWGYAHDSRATEEGIDLNRNFVAFPRPADEDAGSGYSRFHRLLVENYRPFPRGLRGSMGGMLNELRLLSHGMSAGRRRLLQQAVTAGQHAYPHGLFYGGHAPAKSRMAWEEIMHALVAPYPVALLLDLHTGLGKRGCAELMSELPQSNADFQTMSRWFDGRLKSMADNQSVSASLSGTLTSAFLRSGSGRRYALGLEFGTCSPLTVLNALRADQWLRNHDGEPSWKDRQRIRGMMRRAFAPSDERWVEQAVAAFEATTAQLLKGLELKRSAPMLRSAG